MFYAFPFALIHDQIYILCSSLCGISLCQLRFCINSRDNVNNMQQRFGYYERAQARTHALRKHRFQLKMHANIFIHTIESFLWQMYIYMFLSRSASASVWAIFRKQTKMCTTQTHTKHIQNSIVHFSME